MNNRTSSSFLASAVWLLLVFASQSLADAERSWFANSSAQAREWKTLSEAKAAEIKKAFKSKQSSKSYRRAQDQYLAARGAVDG